MRGEADVLKHISIFVCNKNTDIEHFLKEKAIPFEKLGKSRTFIIYDEDAIEFSILAYFTLALQVFKIPESFSNRKIKTLDGFNAKVDGEVITEIPAILIGQLGKSDDCEEGLHGDELMQYCMKKVMEGQERLSGRLVLIECKPISYLMELYSRFGFGIIEQDYEDDELRQMVRIISEEELIENK